MAVQGSLLAQTRPSNTTAAAAFTATLKTEIASIYVANTTGSDAAFSIYHDDDGSTFDESNALYFGVSVAANTTARVDAGKDGEGIAIKASGSLGVKTGTASALTFSIYGITESVT